MNALAGSVCTFADCEQDDPPQPAAEFNPTGKVDTDGWVDVALSYVSFLLLLFTGARNAQGLTTTLGGIRCLKWQRCAAYYRIIL